MGGNKFLSLSDGTQIKTIDYRLSNLRNVIDDVTYYDAADLTEPWAKVLAERLRKYKP